MAPRIAQVLKALALTVAVVLVGFIILVATWLNSFRSVYYAEGPGHLGAAVFYAEQGFLDTTITLYVQDYAASGTKLIRVGPVGDAGGQGMLPKEVRWSSDGAVLAIRQDIYDDTTHKDSLLWTQAYDFSTHKVAPAPPNPLTAQADMSYRIEVLLRAHGGAGHAVDMDWKYFEHPWIWQYYD